MPCRPHLIRCALWGAAVVVTLPFPLACAAASFGLFLASFSLFHDAVHGALGLSQRANDLVLFLTSAPLLMSSHGQRAHHLRHHTHPLEADDLEGAGALMSLWMAALTGPLASVRMRVVAFTAVNDRIRPWVWAENVFNVVVVVAVVLANHLGLTAAFVVAAGLQLTMNAWASHIPHRAPQWLLGLASRVEWTRSPAVLSLVYHLEHHAHPRVPCADLRPNMDVKSPLIDLHQEKLAWAQLKVDARPRPRLR